MPGTVLHNDIGNSSGPRHYTVNPELGSRDGGCQALSELQFVGVGDAVPNPNPPN